MRTPKRVLQDWLGISAIALRVAEIELKAKPNNGIYVNDAGIKFGPMLSLHNKGVEMTEDLGLYNGTPIEANDIKVDELIVTPLSDSIKKGYDKAE